MRRAGRITTQPMAVRHAPLALAPFSLALLSLTLLGLAPGRAHGQAPYAPVGADLLLGGRPAEGVLVLHSGYRNSELLDAAAVVFVGADGSGTAADVLTVSVGVRDPGGLGHARFGRFVLSTGAIRPVHLDGVSVLGRTRTGSTLELFGGMPVVPELGARDFDWLAGARLGQWLWEERLGIGVSYLHRRDGGALADEEVGVDVSAMPLAWLSIHALAAWDLAYAGLSEARIAASAQRGRSQLQVFASHRVAARLLPATSLFSVVSNAPSTEVGSDLLWHAFPRLDVGGTAAVEALDTQLGYRAALRSTLRLDDEGAGDLTAEATRRVLGDEGWSACAVSSRFPISERVRGNASVELVAADDARDRGALWPWSRVGATYAIAPHWTLAAAVGGRATPELESDLYGLLRVSYYEQVQP